MGTKNYSKILLKIVVLLWKIIHRSFKSHSKMLKIIKFCNFNADKLQLKLHFLCWTTLEMFLRHEMTSHILKLLKKISFMIQLFEKFEKFWCARTVTALPWNFLVHSVLVGIINLNILQRTNILKGWESWF
jgi:hypothetical protein